MARSFRLAASLLATVLFASCLSTSSAQGILRKQADAGWSPRSESSAFSNPFPQLVPTATAEGRTFVPANSLWVYGGLDEQDVGLSDTWVTTDGAKTWLQVESRQTVADLSRSADCYSHQTGRIYAITGSTPGGGDQRTSRIVASNNGINWEVIVEDALFQPRERPGCTVDSRGVVYMFGGSTRSADGSTAASNDIWSSTNLGVTWRVSPRPRWLPRISTDTQTFSSPVFNKDLIYIESGDGGSKNGTPPGYGFHNDVFVSSDGARSWWQLTANAPFPYRKDAELTITNNGVLIVASGDTDDGNANDLWTSLDGGYTVRCSSTQSSRTTQQRSWLSLFVHCD